jgi:hypothetical protein
MRAGIMAHPALPFRRTIATAGLWPREVPAPPPNRLWRLLARAVKLGTLAQEGTGRRNDPLRYSLPG